ncbi:DUF456 domain-containing protein [Peribacillus saganii]|uniref:DUF456 domain-containing protein n=1 Tax=Peribacillus saganii TaxID=2303992 RepID=A0A372LEQ9_9BACI|nr:DUF456 domain-containing protein [Peribacillus saganii]RFU64300.1 DUF456 domain-containing protein [Peribacillus saganii]
MESIYWILISVIFLVGFIGLVFPIIPSVLFIIGGMLLYGVLFSFEPFNWLFWSVQIIFVLLLFAADYVANMLGVKKYGGSKAAIWGSTIGILAGPFIIPVIGLLIGPFAGAILAELIVHKKDFNTSVKIGLGSVFGFISSVAAKAFIQLLMVGYFTIEVL